MPTPHETVHVIANELRARGFELGEDDEEFSEFVIRVLDDLRARLERLEGPGIWSIRAQTIPTLYWLAGGHLVELGTFLREAKVIGGKPNHQKLERPELDMLVAYLRWVLVELDQDMKKGPFAS